MPQTYFWYAIHTNTRTHTSLQQSRTKCKTLMVQNLQDLVTKKYQAEQTKNCCNYNDKSRNDIYFQLEFFDASTATQAEMDHCETIDNISSWSWYFFESFAIFLSKARETRKRRIMKMKMHIGNALYFWIIISITMKK